jgi:hypothetical protein
VNCDCLYDDDWYDDCDVCIRARLRRDVDGMYTEERADCASPAVEEEGRRGASLCAWLGAGE